MGALSSKPDSQVLSAGDQAMMGPRPHGTSGSPHTLESSGQDPLPPTAGDAVELMAGGVSARSPSLLFKINSLFSSEETKAEGEGLSPPSLGSWLKPRRPRRWPVPVSAGRYHEADPCALA